MNKKDFYNTLDEIKKLPTDEYLSKWLGIQEVDTVLPIQISYPYDPGLTEEVNTKLQNEMGYYIEKNGEQLAQQIRGKIQIESENLRVSISYKNSEIERMDK